ncbi:MAG: OmpA family protein [Bacteroidales bacterium]|nr:OmpA family protein [Bacteroidales bacterium]
MRANLICGILLSVCLSFSWISGSSQEYLSYSPKRLKALGDNALEIGDTYSARDYYKAYCDKKKDDGNVLFLLAECYRASREYISAATYYDKAFKTDKSNLLALYHYGEMLKIYGYYDDAKKCFLQFKQKYRGGDDIDYKHLVALQIVACDSAKVLLEKNPNAEFYRLNTSINKHSVEFSPMYLNDSTLLYASLRTDTALYVIKNHSDSEMPYRHFYVAKKRGGSWQYGNEWLEGDFNVENCNTGNGVFSPDKKKFYFSKCEQNWRYKSICKIYVSYYNRGWSEPQALPESINKKKVTNTQPTIGLDSKTGAEVLYFVSDRPGGKGGMDIWYSVYSPKNNKWTESKNCGNKINTTADEVTPFYSVADRMLYFSSNGHGGLGELDVYKTSGEMAKWLEIENLGVPINSGFDDLYYSSNALNTEGFFTSNRQSDKNASTCCDDIFAFKYVDRISIGLKGKVYLLPNKIVDSVLHENIESLPTEMSEDSVQYIEGTVVSLFWYDEKEQTKYFVASDTTDSTGSYFFDLTAGKKYVLQYESSKFTPPERDVSTVGFTYSDTLQLEDVGIDYLPRERFVIKNIYYEFDKAQLTFQAKRTIKHSLVTILNEFPQIVVEIGSHTDSKGNENYNLKLSQKRAESVVNYLIECGIEPERLRAKGYGESMPIAPNETEDGDDNPEGRSKNRRTEFRVIGTLKQYFEIIYEE